MSTDIKLYTGEEEAYFSQGQLNELDKALDQRLISKRKGGFGKMLSYIEGHDAIDQANRIFGYGNWCYRPLSVEQVVLLDPLSGEAVGIEYKSQVELTVRGAIGPIIDIGSQPVATWNVEDQIMQRRLKAANGGKVNESEFTLIEKREARAVIVEAHEQAKKGAVTDALKRALRAFGNQFGNGLYGDGHIDLSDPVPTGRTVVNAVQPKQIAPPVVEDQPADAQTMDKIRAFCKSLRYDAPTEPMTQQAAANFLKSLQVDYRDKKKTA